jgi:hypothetical protein
MGLVEGIFGKCGADSEGWGEGMKAHEALIGVGPLAGVVVVMGPEKRATSS